MPLSFSKALFSKDRLLLYILQHYNRNVAQKRNTANSHFFFQAELCHCHAVLMQTFSSPPSDHFLHHRDWILSLHIDS